MSYRRILFRIWHIAKQEFLELDELNACVAMAMNYPDEFILHQYINIDDINGRMIYEGDIIVQYPDNYQVEKRGSVYEIMYDKPRLPLRDVVVHKGFVYYYPAAYWMGTISGLNMVNGSVRLSEKGVYEVIGSVVGTPELLRGNGLEIDMGEEEP